MPKSETVAHESAPKSLRPLRRHAWRALLGAGGLLLALYLFVPPLKGSGVVMNLLGLAPVLGILGGLRLHRPPSPWPWHCFAIGFVLFWFGDLYTYSYPLLLGGDVPFPSVGDAAYLLVYPFLAAGLIGLVRRRGAGRDRGGVIDASIMTVGLALPSWVWLITPYLHDHSLSTVGRLVSVAYPMADVLLLAVATRMILAAGHRRPAFHLLSASIVALLATDFVYGLMTLNGTYDHQLWLDAGWIAFYLAWGAAALHPSMPDIERPVVAEDRVLTTFRLALLAGASLIAPVIGLSHDLALGDYDLGVVRAASIVLFGLVVARMAGLVRQQEKSLERERILTAAGAQLVAATTQEDIDAVAVHAGAQVVGPDTVAALYRTRRDGWLELVASSFEGAGREPSATAQAALAQAAPGDGAADLTGAVRLELGLP